MLSYKCTVLFALFAMNLMEQPAPEVTLEQGVVRGKINTDGKTHEYMGIPYATVRDRFKAPLAAPSWEGVYKAVDEHYQCPQQFGGFVLGMEDCLKINVYVPALTQAKLLPVMVQIHGGAFIFGNGGKIFHGPDFLVKHDVILVTFNYRLGALGFLCLGIEEAPGNAGLKDQVAALRWVKKNIAAFGGDPDNVTILGQSAGGASAALLAMSNATNGLIKRAIVQSGSALAHWASEDGITIASSIAKQLNFHDTKDPHELYNFFANIPVEELVRVTRGLSILQMMVKKFVTTPCIEKRIPGVEPIFTEMPYDIIKQNPKDISVMYGVTDREGLFLVDEKKVENLKDYNEELYHYPDFEFPSKDVAETVAKEVKEFYLGDKEAGTETRENLIKLFGDTYFDTPLLLESEVMVSKPRNTSIYNYYFQYSGGRNVVKSMYSGNEHGASHGDDIMYLFNGYLLPFKVKKRDQQMIDVMTRMWTNFAKYGDPTPASDKDLPIRWKPSTEHSLNFLYIDQNLKMGPYPNPERHNLWKKLLLQYRKQR